MLYDRTTVELDGVKYEVEFSSFSNRGFRPSEVGKGVPLEEGLSAQVRWPNGEAKVWLIVDRLKRDVPEELLPQFRAELEKALKAGFIRAEPDYYAWCGEKVQPYQLWKPWGTSQREGARG